MGSDAYWGFWGAAKALGPGMYLEHCIDGAYVWVVCVPLEQYFFSVIAVFLFTKASFC